MFTYNYRLFDRYARPVVSLAVLGEGQREPSGQFRYGRWGGETRFIERRALLRLVRRRFGEPTTERSIPILARITQPARLEDLFEELLDCPDDAAWLLRLRAAQGDDAPDSQGAV